MKLKRVGRIKDIRNKIKYIVTSALLFTVLIAYPLQSFAQFPVTVTTDVPFTIARTLDNIEEKVTRSLVHTLGMTVVNTITNLTMTLSQKLAEELAAGFTGQQGMFELRGFGQIMEDVKGNVLGELIGSLSEADLFKDLGLNLCNPKLDIKVNLTYALLQEQGIQEVKPKCDWDDIRSNWENLAETIDNGQILESISLSAQVSNAPSVTFMQLMGAPAEKMEEERQALIKQAIECQQAQRKTGFHGNLEETCAQTYEKLGKLSGTLEKMDEKDFAMLGPLDELNSGLWLVKAGNQFLNTFYGKVINHYMSAIFSEIQKFGSGSSGPLNDEQIRSLYTGVGTFNAKPVFSQEFEFVTTPFRIEASNFEIVSQFVTCPDRKYAGINNCVIDSAFAQAIQQNMTVQQAMNAKLLHEEWLFGYISTSGELVEPEHNKGYSISNMKKLRRARILPIGWEMAAQIIPEKYTNDVKTLGFVLSCFEDAERPYDSAYPVHCRDSSGINPLWRMVDPAWLLKPPLLECRKTYNGQVVNQQSGARIEECSDFHDCVRFDTNGSCIEYGYCTKEAGVWDFDASRTCLAAHNSCEVLTDKNNNIFAYIENTLDRGTGVGTCDGSNAGCLWYSKNQDASGNWLHKWNEGEQCSVNADCQAGFSCVNGLCASNGNADVVYLNQQVQSCDPSNEGCERLLRLQPNGNKSVKEIFDDVHNNPVPGANEFVYAAQAQVFDYYMKLAPDYYNCYDANIGNDAPECALFTPMCSEHEQGCTLYTNITNPSQRFSAVTHIGDYCPQVCAGYQRYSQEATNFASGVFPADFIASSAQSCQAQNAGCTEFTNLDEVARGGEGLQYYTEIRQCQKPQPDCATFYTWVGSDVSGFQLQSYTLKADQNTGAPVEVQNIVNGGACANSQDAQENPRCKELFTQGGLVHYVIFDNTVSCSDNCHPLRKTKEIKTQFECEKMTDQNNNQGVWDGFACSIEKDDCAASGGAWNTNVNACEYNAIPAQGKLCSAQANMCRAYRGNTANNIVNKLQITFDDFSIGQQPPNFQSVNANGSPIANTALVSADAIVVGGKSMNFQNYVAFVQGNSGVREYVERGKTYTLKFIARSSQAGTFNAEFRNGNSVMSFGSVALTTEWATYEIGPVFFDEDVHNQVVSLILFASENTYIDDITLVEARDMIYVIKDSWNTPLVCDTSANLQGGVAQESMLSCQGYRDTDNNTHFVKSFSQLCSSDRVGCAAFIRTHNTSSPYEVNISGGANPQDDLTIAADQLLYLVDNQKYYCSQQFAGCQKLAQPKFNNDKTAVSEWVERYYINDPNQYATISCIHEELFCKEYFTSGGNKFYKDPGNQLCEYKEILGTSPKRFAWYKKDSNELCDLRLPSDYNGNRADPESNHNCIYDQTKHEWYALDAGGNRVSCSYACVKDPITQEWRRPADNLPCDPGYRGWVGTCSSAQNQCTRFIDPASSESQTNLLTNGSFESPYKRCSVGGGACDDDLDCSAGVCQEYTLGGTWQTTASIGTVSVSRVQGVANIFTPFDGSSVLSVDMAGVPGNFLQFSYPMLRTIELGVSYYVSAKVYVSDPANPQVKTISDNDSITLTFTMGDSNNWVARAQVSGSQLQPGTWNTIYAQTINSMGIPGQVINTTTNQVSIAIENSDSTPILLFVDDVKLVQQNQFHYISDYSIDTKSCNGRVDIKQGCVLFNDTGNSSLLFHAESTGALGSPNAQCGGIGQPLCDSNSVIRVRQDRQCREYLQCTSDVAVYDPTSAKTIRVCQALGRFSLNSQGEVGAVFSEGYCARVVPNQNRFDIQRTDINCISDIQCSGSNEFCDTRLTRDAYQQRDTGFGSVDYTGLSIPDIFPVERLRQYNYRYCQFDPQKNRCTSDSDCGGNTGPCVDDWRLTYVGTKQNVQVDLGMNGKSVVTQGMVNLAQSKPEFITPFNDIGFTRAKICRGYPEQDSPINEMQHNNPGMENAKVGAPQNDVLCDYEKVSTSFQDFYYEIGKVPGVAQIKTDHNIDNSIDLIINNKRLKRGFKGYCLEEDRNTPLYGSSVERVCSTWHPLDLLFGEFDFFSNTKLAGMYVDDSQKYYCVESEILEYRQPVSHVGSTTQDHEWTHSGRCESNNYWQFSDDKIKNGAGNQVCPDLGPINKADIHEVVNNLCINNLEGHPHNGGDWETICCVPIRPGTAPGQREIWAGWVTTDGFMDPRYSTWNNLSGCYVQERTEKAQEVCTLVASVSDAEKPIVGFTNRLKNLVVDDVNGFQGTGVEIPNSDITALGEKIKHDSGYGLFGRIEAPDTGNPTQWKPAHEKYALRFGPLTLGHLTQNIQSLSGASGEGIYQSKGLPAVFSGKLDILPEFIKTSYSCKGICQFLRNGNNQVVHENLFPANSKHITDGYFQAPIKGKDLFEYLFVEYSLFRLNADKENLDNRTDPSVNNIQQINYYSSTLVGPSGSDRFRTPKNYDPNKISDYVKDNFNQLVANNEYPQVKQVNDLGVQAVSFVGRFQEGNDGITVNGINSGNITSPTSGLFNANVTFYAFDPTGDHMPISEVIVDWGDGTSSISGGYSVGGSLPNRRSFCEPQYLDANQQNPNPAYNFGHADGACIQNNAERPGYYLFTHTYVCIPGGGDFWDPVLKECRFTPKVRVTDNWGLCSNGKYRGFSTNVPAQIIYSCNETHNFYQSLPSNVIQQPFHGPWVVYGGQVIVKP